MLFEDRPVGAVLDEVERRFDTRIHVEPASIRRERITLLFDSVEDPEDILTTVASVRGYTFESTSSGYLLSAP
jgi:ferric-dicitrate binding protein FerR (iron transport regulator)